jgi:hypothetical protein
MYQQRAKNASIEGRNNIGGGVVNHQQSRQGSAGFNNLRSSTENGQLLMKKSSSGSQKANEL